jgi:hypothetical protein
LYFLFVLAVFPQQAGAFPVAEGAGAISSLIGVITSVIVGFFPKSGLGHLDRKFTAAVFTAVLTSFVALGAIGWAVNDSRADRDWKIVAAQSRPKVELAGEIRREIAAEVIPVMTNEEQEYARLNNVFVDLEDYRAGRVAPTALRVYLQSDATTRLAVPYQSVQAVQAGDYEALTKLARARHGDILLIADHRATIVRAAMAIEDQTGYRLQGLPIRTSDFSLTRERQTENQTGSETYPTIHDPDHVFQLPLIDLRTPQNILETHTLVNASNITATDFLLMRDSEILTLFQDQDSARVLIGYDKHLYPVIHDRLKDLVPGRYVFYRGGLEAHFLEDHLTLTPFYYNMRFVDPGALIDLYGLTDKVRFICTVPGTCLDNIPETHRVSLDFRSLGKDAFSKAIRALPQDRLYVTVTTNQETYGNSLMTGYWLTTSGHDYLGDLVMPTRFSLEDLRARILTATGGEPSLQEWREMHSTYLGVIETLKSLISRYGWLVVFAGMGALVRLSLTPFQIIVFGSYYQSHQRILPMLGAALAIPGALVAAYRFLDHAISYWAIVPHSTMNTLAQGQVQSLLPAFVAMIAFQILISFPRRPRTALPIIGLVVGIWLLGWMDTLALPLLVFLMASETIALLLQLPFFANFYRRIRDEKEGITTRPMPEAKPDDYPAKWFKLTAFRPQPGFLVNLRKLEIGSRALDRHLRKLDGAGKLIVRSAALDPREERLGGYYSSHVISPEKSSVLKALYKVKINGCAFAWVQPFYDTDENGVLASISRDGRRAECIFGPGDSATEGSHKATTLSLDSKDARRTHRGEWRLLRAAERHARGPVILEYGRLGNRIIPYQLRLMHEITHPEVKLWPAGREGYVLAEDYMARCSRITGDILEEATGGYYKAVRGFLYRKNAPARRTLRINQKAIEALQDRALALLENNRQETHRGPAAALADLEEGISVLRGLFRASQAYLRPKAVSTTLDICAIRSTENSELEILGRRDILKRIHQAPAQQIETREHLHNLIVVTTAALGKLITRSVPDPEWQWRIGLCDLRETPEVAPPPRQQDTSPMTSAETADDVIVAGEIKGTPWPSDRKDLPPMDGTRWILAGEEISSEWVRHLQRFSGILSVYGHPNAHLGLSARALGIPYRRISSETLSVFLSGQGFPPDDAASEISQDCEARSPRTTKSKKPG